MTHDIISVSRRLVAAWLLAALPLSAAHSQEPIDTSRLVAVGGSLTEIVYALGEEDRLVARDTTSIYPPQALELPDVGYMRALSPEGVLSINPTAIIALAGSGPAETMDVLRKASVPVITVPETFDRAGITAKIEAVGNVLGVEGKAAELAARVDADIRKAEAAAAGIVEKKKVLFVLSLQGGKILASGAGTAADGMLALAGAENALSGFTGYKQVTDESIIEAAPDAVLMMNRVGEHASAAEDILVHPAIATTPAGRSSALVRMDGSWLLGFGPRTAEAIVELNAALYGGQGQ